MKTLLTALCLLSGVLYAGSATTVTEQTHGYTTIHAQELKSWYDQGKEMTVIDARSKPYFDGVLLPQAKWLSYDVSEKDLNTALPSKEALIVVYCSSTACPASKYLADRLVKSGYKNIYKYPEGLADWTQKNYPTTKL